MFLLFLVLVCFLANFFFSFEDEHLLASLIVCLLCLSLALIVAACDDLVKQKQVETYKLLLKRRVLATFLFSESQTTAQKLAFSVNFFASTCVVFAKSVPEVLFEDCFDVEFNTFQMTVNKLLQNHDESVFFKQSGAISEFAVELVESLTLEE